jgi:hypothetical protein
MWRVVTIPISFDPLLTVHLSILQRWASQMIASAACEYRLSSLTQQLQIFRRRWIPSQSGAMKLANLTAIFPFTGTRAGKLQACFRSAVRFAPQEKGDSPAVTFL